MSGAPITRVEVLVGSTLRSPSSWKLPYLCSERPRSNLSIDGLLQTHDALDLDLTCGSDTSDSHCFRAVHAATYEKAVWDFFVPEALQAMFPSLLFIVVTQYAFGVRCSGQTLASSSQRMQTRGSQSDLHKPQGGPSDYLINYTADVYTLRAPRAATLNLIRLQRLNPTPELQTTPNPKP